ncbi:hypothetical protein ES706_01817 [subsurface metagenome]
MNILSGWQIDKDLGVYRIPIRITNPETKVSLVKHCLFDTGFSGYLGLDNETNSILNLPKIGQGKGITVKGLIEYDNYEGIIEIVADNQKSLVKIVNIDKTNENSEKKVVPVQDFDIPIIGIKSIRQCSWLILSEKDFIFILK